VIRTAKPIFWPTGSMHSPEIGSPEVLMHLAHRLTMDEVACAREIRGGELERAGLGGQAVRRQGGQRIAGQPRSAGSVAP
jgi:hypothetical protein